MSIRLQPRVSAAGTADGIVLLNEQYGRYWQLNSSGAATLGYLLDGDTPAEAAQKLANSYGISLARATADVDALIDALQTAGLVTT